jgi:DNA mismatch endonuclease (patch repair protein)
MVDVHTKLARSRNMAAIRAKNTKPELIVRSVLHRMGYRYRLHRKDLPGKPDIVFASKLSAIFVHGCFWHTHDCRYGRVVPATNASFWQSKREANVERDRRTEDQLKRSGWKVLTLWECQIGDNDWLVRQLREFLG